METRLEVVGREELLRVRAIGSGREQFGELAALLLLENEALLKSIDPRTGPGVDITVGQCHFWAVMQLATQVMNGGLLQFFWNCPEWAEHVEEGLRALGLDELAGHFERAMKQLCGDMDRYVELRRNDTLQGYVDAAAEVDFEWFDEAFLGEWDEASGRWTGLVDGLYTETVAWVWGNVEEFVVRLKG